MPDWFTSKSDPARKMFPKEAALDSLRYVVLDTELTSLDRRTNRLLSIGAVAMQGASVRLGEQFYRLVDPRAAIPAETVVIHKLRSEDVEGAEDSGTILNEFVQFSARSVLVGHFVEFDLKALRKEIGETHTIDNPAVDTARIHTWILRHGLYSEDLATKLEKLDLPTLAAFYSVDVQDAHHALADAFLTARIWQKMLTVLRGKGVVSLGKLLKIGGVK